MGRKGCWWLPAQHTKAGASGQHPSSGSALGSDHSRSGLVPCDPLRVSRELVSPSSWHGDRKGQWDGHGGRTLTCCPRVCMSVCPGQGSRDSRGRHWVRIGLPLSWPSREQPPPSPSAGRHRSRVPSWFGSGLGAMGQWAQSRGQFPGHSQSQGGQGQVHTPPVTGAEDPLKRKGRGPGFRHQPRPPGPWGVRPRGFRPHPQWRGGCPGAGQVP